MTATIDDYVYKWRKMLRGVDIDHHAVVAWCLEREVRFLQEDVRRDGFPRHVLKYFIPALRLAAERVHPISAVDRLAQLAGQCITEDQVLDVFHNAFLEVVDAQCSIQSTRAPDEPLPDNVRQLIDEAAARMLESIREFPVAA